MSRRKPYTERGIGRVTCFRCGSPAAFQWQICADGNIWRPLCGGCDVALNRLVLRWMGFADWKERIKRYVRRHAA